MVKSEKGSKCPYVDECDAFRCIYRGGDLHPSWINPCKWFQRRKEEEFREKYPKGNYHYTDTCPRCGGVARLIEADSICGVDMVGIFKCDKCEYEYATSI